MLILLNICHQKKNLRRIRDIGVFSESILITRYRKTLDQPETLDQETLDHRYG